MSLSYDSGFLSIGSSQSWFETMKFREERFLRWWNGGGVVFSKFSFLALKCSKSNLFISNLALFHMFQLYCCDLWVHNVFSLWSLELHSHLFFHCLGCGIYDLLCSVFLVRLWCALWLIYWKLDFADLVVGGKLQCCGHVHALQSFRVFGMAKMWRV